MGFQPSDGDMTPKIGGQHDPNDRAFMLSGDNAVRHAITALNDADPDAQERARRFLLDVVAIKDMRPEIIVEKLKSGSYSHRDIILALLFQSPEFVAKHFEALEPVLLLQTKYLRHIQDITLEEEHIQNVRFSFGYGEMEAINFMMQSAIGNAIGALVQARPDKYIPYFERQFLLPETPAIERQGLIYYVRASKDRRLLPVLRQRMVVEQSRGVVLAIAGAMYDLPEEANGPVLMQVMREFPGSSHYLFIHGMLSAMIVSKDPTCINFALTMFDSVRESFRGQSVGVRGGGILEVPALLLRELYPTLDTTMQNDIRETLTYFIEGALEFLLTEQGIAIQGQDDSDIPMVENRMNVLYSVWHNFFRHSNLKLTENPDIRAGLIRCLSISEPWGYRLTGMNILQYELPAPDFHDILRNYIHGVLDQLDPADGDAIEDVIEDLFELLRGGEELPALLQGVFGITVGQGFMLEVVIDTYIHNYLNR